MRAAAVILAGLVAAVAAARMRAMAGDRVLRTMLGGPVAPAYGGALTIDARTGHAAMATPTGIYLLDARAGSLVRAIPLNQGYTLALAADGRAGRIIVAGARGSVVLDARGGAVLHTAASLFPVAIVVAEREGHAFVLNGMGYGGRVTMLDARTGRVLRTTAVGRGDARTGAAMLAIDPRSGHVFVTSPDDDRVRVLDARTGAIIAAYRVDHAPSIVAVDERRRHVFVATDDGIAMLDARSGAILHRAILSDIATDMAIDERTDRVFTVDDTDHSSISMLDARTGVPLRTIKVAGNPNPSAIAVDQRAGRVYVTSQGGLDPDPAQVHTFLGTGAVYVLDAHTGSLLRTLPAGVAPGAIAVDEPTGHVLVFNSGGVVRVADPWGWAPAWLRRWLPAAGERTRTVAGSVDVLDPAQ